MNRAAGRGFLYELGRGRIVVSDVPGHQHLLQLEQLKDQISAYLGLG